RRRLRRRGDEAAARGLVGADPLGLRAPPGLGPRVRGRAPAAARGGAESGRAGAAPEAGRRLVAAAAARAARRLRERGAGGRLVPGRPRGGRLARASLLALARPPAPAAPALAHQFAPALLEVEELPAGEAAVSWKQPAVRVQGSQLRPVLPVECEGVGDPQVQ